MLEKNMKKWPVLKSYSSDNLRRIALPLGGIGTGTVSLGGRGNLQDWAIMNSPAVGYTPSLIDGMRDVGPFFAIYTESAGITQVRALEGLLDSECFEASHGSRAVNHGLPRFRECSFDAAYPLGQVHLADEDVPVTVTLQAFNPLIPADSKRSGIPAAVLRYCVTNNSDKDVTVSVCGTIENCIGADGRDYTKDWDGKRLYTGSMDNKNEFREDAELSGIYMSSDGVAADSVDWGTMALTTLPGADDELSYRTAWAKRTWGGSLLDFWDDFSENGVISERVSEAPFNRMASLAVKRTLAAGESNEFTYYLSWHFPNRMTWAPEAKNLRMGSSNNDTNIIGNYYTTRYKDAWDAAEYIAKNHITLEEDTVAFVDAFCSSDLPLTIKEAALFNISTLRTQTCFRTPDGHFFGWEGIHDLQGSCYGSCTHVWNYEQATAFLFGDLAMSMRDVEFMHATDESGHMNFRVELPLHMNKDKRGFAAADGQMGCIMKMYRDWQLSGENERLKVMWPAVRRALEFCWVEGGWDADKDGVMEGCQHNTMDVEYYGPNPQMQGWYLGALRSAEEMARALGDDDFAQLCRDLFTKGSLWMDEHLFNGDYYEHIIQVPENIHSKLTSSMGAKDLSDPILQLGSGCLIDQLVGQYMAHVTGLGYLHDREKVEKTLASIMEYNFHEGFHDHFNAMRSYVLNDESALLMASYPKGRRPDEPFPYFTEVMTGFEHTAAAHMLYEGQTEPAMQVITAIRERYDGFKRNPFDEAECGHHYARAMASWAEVLAVTGFRYSAVTEELFLAAKEGNWFWSNGYAWGSYTLVENSGSWKLSLQALYGEIMVKSVQLDNGCGWKGSDTGKAFELDLHP
jgi:non-lysosomal glucosylceramidase